MGDNHVLLIKEGETRIEKNYEDCYEELRRKGLTERAGFDVVTYRGEEDRSRSARLAEQRSHQRESSCQLLRWPAFHACHSPLTQPEPPVPGHCDFSCNSFNQTSHKYRFNAGDDDYVRR
ncbi:unnamed protein product [Angiostrongylus costaricensis]|uniref:ERCC4 domain-containing protein n=1 Tax=Angiostrongylus costaricensis TaxID=334426 RepID=A0A0R3PHV8_ANGCS|nr:unnamed protein product [Angiostrongylus costaricensis]